MHNDAIIKKGEDLNAFRSWHRAGIVMAILSFLIYAGALFSLPQVRDNPFAIERSALAAAVSHVSFGAGFGKIGSNLLDFFQNPEHISTPLQTLLNESSLITATSGTLLKKSVDGCGVGYVLVATCALGLFGLHAWALLLFMLALMGLSAAIFLWRFSEKLAYVVVLFFCSLTVMLFSPLVWEPNYSLQVAVGGIRYFSLVAILPVFHLLFDILNLSNSSINIARRDNVLLALQTAILILVILVRSTPALMFGVIVLTWLLLVFKNRHKSGLLQVLTQKSVVIALTGIGLVGVLLLAVPRPYIRDGYFGQIFWHRIVISLGLNPAWPIGFGNLREVYNSEPHIPEGLLPGLHDRNGHCIWIAYSVKHGIPPAEMIGKLYGRQYEKVMRKAFFDIARKYPEQVLKTFFYYKPRMIIPSLVESLQIDMCKFPPRNNELLIASLANAFLCCIFSPLAPRSTRCLIGLFTLLFAALCAITYIIAWATPISILDLSFLCLFLSGLILEAILQAVAHCFGGKLAPFCKKSD